MGTTKYALATAAQLAEELAMRLPALAVSQSFDTDGSPLIQIGAGTAGSAGGIVKVMPISWPAAQDILGNTQQIYTPHVIKVGLEANYAGTTDNVADVNTLATVMAILGSVALRGSQVQVYQSTNGVAPTAATLADATKLQTTFVPNLQYPFQTL